MIRIVEDAAARVEVWTLVFDREAARPWMNRLIPGRHKHVRAYAYVPFLKVWIFYEPTFWGTDVILARDGPAALALIGTWMGNADAMRMVRNPERMRLFDRGLFCVGAVKRLIRLRGGALLPSTLWRHCLAAGGVPFENPDERAEIPSPAARPVVPAAF